jgi:hypothetical protein
MNFGSWNCFMKIGKILLILGRLPAQTRPVTWAEILAFGLRVRALGPSGLRPEASRRGLLARGRRPVIPPRRPIPLRRYKVCVTSHP